MVLTAENKSDVVSKFKRGDADTGSPEVQIGLLSARLDYLTEHFKTHKHDHHSRQGLLRVVNQRRKLLDYLKKKDSTRYREVVNSLGLRK
ncbi:MAG: 30S ribosomal protein S15 [Immundisolibacteraceae bacterium]|nr:30S ribosomal protein S15 [Immundisolibacteraceae bacterium]